MKVALSEVLRVKHGYAFKGKYFEPAGEKLVLTPGNFAVGGGIQLRDGKERYYHGSYPAGFDLQPGDLLVAMTDLTQGAPILGSPITIPSDGRHYLHNQRLGKVEIDSNRLDRRFAYYMFVWDGVRAQLRASATGATVRHTAPERIGRVVIDLPPLAAQRRIAAVLSAYDDLTENNDRRIKLLEEMARRIYREWFVDFRYPGHEDIPLVDSGVGRVPRGWHVGPLREAVELVYGKALKADDRRDGPVPVFGSSGRVGWHDEALVEGPGIVVGRKGNVGSVMWSDAPFFPIDTTYFVRSKLPLTYTFFALRELQFIDSHAAVPGLSREQAYALPWITPESTTLARFDSLVSATFALRGRIEQMSGNLRGTRDLLIPRLMGGDIRVDDLDIPVEEVAA